ncbi:MAG: hypothetical protein ACXABY_29710 [Candidatus Thorarchaeota archaeon]|jgi:hypothetical protein
MRNILVWAMTIITIGIATTSVAIFAFPTPQIKAPSPVHKTVETATSAAEAVCEGQDIDIYDDTREAMIADIIDVWKLALLEKAALPKDKRRGKLREYAEYIADAVMFRQEVPTKIPGRMVTLPSHRSSHILMAVVAFNESRLWPRTVGKKRREVGLFQCHGRCLAGYTRKQVRNDAQLGVDLGVRWMTIMIAECPSSRRKMKKRPDKWNSRDWLKPLTVYGSGIPTAQEPNGTCKVFSFARWRVHKVRTYIIKIDRARKQGVPL